MKKLSVLGLLMLTVACTSAGDVAKEAALTYSAPFLAVSSGSDCDHKLKVAQELHKLQAGDHPELKKKVDGAKSDSAFKTTLEAEVKKIHDGGASKGFQSDCPAQAKELASIVADTAKALGIDGMIPAWP